MIETIINEVQIRPFIWSKADKSYKDAIKSRNAWISIAEKTHLDAKKVKSKWKSLRDHYVREIKKLHSGSGRKSGPIWPWMSALSFLDDEIKCRETSSNWSQDTTEQTTGTSSGIDMEFQNDESEVGDNAPRSETPKSFKSAEQKRKRTAHTDAVDHTIVQYFTTKKNEDEDEDSLFARSIGASMSKLPPHIKRHVKLSIMQIINAAQEDQEKEMRQSYERVATYES